MCAFSILRTFLKNFPSKRTQNDARERRASVLGFSQKDFYTYGHFIPQKSLVLVLHTKWQIG